MIKIITVGKIKEKFFLDAISEYKKRLSKYTKLEIIEILDDFDKDENIILLKEKEKIMKHINVKDYIISLTIEGNHLSSQQFAEKIDKIFISNANITFIIGSSYGIHPDIKKLSNYELSFSKMTFPHQLFRIILLEQIYRSYKINNNETYHK